MNNRIDERLEVMGVNTSGMTDEQKFTAATGLTRYSEYEANNPWYVPGGAANVKSEETGEQGATDQGQPTGEQGQTYTAEEAAAYNAKLDGAVKEGDVKVEGQNAVLYTTEEIEAHNAELDIWEEGKVKTEAVEEVLYTAEDEEVIAGNKEVGDVKVEGQDAVLYTTEEIEAHNTELDIWEEGKVKTEAVEEVLYTQEEADAYNATLSGAKKAGDPKASSAEVITES